MSAFFRTCFQTGIKFTATIVLVSGLLFSMIAPATATANPLVTKEATQYESANPPQDLQEFRTQMGRASDRATENSKELIDNSQNQLQDLADTVREKLNLDEPIDPHTKEFFEDVQENINSMLPGR